MKSILRTIWISIAALGVGYLFLNTPALAAGDLAEGRALFGTHCSMCHGAGGGGDGAAAYLLMPKPRDLTSGIFKLKSTPLGTLPTDEDIFRIITEGIPGTSMPSWAYFSEKERLSLVAYVKSLSPRFSAEEPGEPLQFSSEPATDAASANRGKELFSTMGCVTCHGTSGRGDGPAAQAGLFDIWNNPVHPRDFVGEGNKIRRGGRSEDLFKSIKLGLEGTPMASYTFLTDDQVWDLVHYVQSLGARPATYSPSKAQEVTIQLTDGEIPLDPTDPRWREMPATPVPVRLLWTRGGTDDFVLVRGLANSSEVGIYVEWADSSANSTVLRPQDFRDAVAVQFPSKFIKDMADAPFSGMGSAASPVNIWQWKADWQQDMDGFTDIGAQYAGLADEYYPQDSTEKQTFSSGWAAGNLLSAQSRRSPVEDLVAAGQGTLTSQPLASQNVNGRGVWANGIWRVVFKRSLKSSDEGDVQFTQETAEGLLISVAVWDGAANDRNGQKSVSEWHRLRALPGRIVKANGDGGCEMNALDGNGAGAYLLLALGAVLGLGINRRRADRR